MSFLFCFTDAINYYFNSLLLKRSTISTLLSRNFELWCQKSILYYYYLLWYKPKYKKWRRQIAFGPRYTDLQAIMWQIHINIYFFVNVITKFGDSAISYIHSVSFWVQWYLWPYIKIIPDFHAVRYIDVKFGEKRVLVLDWYSVSVHELRYWNQWRKSWLGASPKNISSSQKYSDI